MQSEQSGGRYINSVSDLLYSPDEIEFLLDDIRDLEPTSFNPEDIQDFEIAGSRTGVLDSEECPAGGCECESPLGTVNSWDSHSHYRRRDSADISVYSGVIVYCDHHHLRTPVGIFRLLLLGTTIACLTCLCTSGTVKVGLFMLPLVGRIRVMMFVTLVSIFMTCAVLFLDISHMVYLFPFPWGKISTYLYLSISMLFLIASSLIFHMIFLSEAFSWVPKWTHHQLLATGILGYICCLESAVLCLIHFWKSRPHNKRNTYELVCEDPSMNLQEKLPSPNSPLDTPERKKLPSKHLSITHNYQPTMAVNLAVNLPSTSRQNKPVNYVDDVQPCSSKSADYNVISLA